MKKKAKDSFVDKAFNLLLKILPTKDENINALKTTKANNISIKTLRSDNEINERFKSKGVRLEDNIKPKENPENRENNKVQLDDDLKVIDIKNNQVAASKAERIPQQNSFNDNVFTSEVKETSNSSNIGKKLEIDFEQAAIMRDKDKELRKNLNNLFSEDEAEDEIEQGSEASLYIQESINLCKIIKENIGDSEEVETILIEDFARQKKLMFDALLDSTNEYGFEKTDKLLLEKEGDVIYVDISSLKMLLKGV